MSEACALLLTRSRGLDCHIDLSAAKNAKAVVEIAMADMIFTNVFIDAITTVSLEYARTVIAPSNLLSAVHG